MALLKCYAVDDEKRAINSLNYIVKEYCSKLAYMEGNSNNIEEAYLYLSSEHVDVLFLDIRMGTDSGFDLLKKIAHLEQLHVVIITAYDEYAIQAFKYNASDYLLKPIDPIELQKTLERIETKILQKKASNTVSTINTLQERIFIADSKGWESYLLKDIVFFKADNVYTHIYLTDGTSHLVGKNLGYIEKVFLEKNTDFIRVQKSYSVNRNHVVRINNTDTGSLIMVNKIEIPISAKLKKEVINQLLQT